MKVVTDQQHYQDIAQAIRAKTGSTDRLIPAEMAPAIEGMVPVDALPRAEGATFCTDSTLPEIPVDVLATYPKAVMFRVTSASSEQIVYLASADSFLHIDSSLSGLSNDFIGCAGAAVKSTASNGTWGDQVSVAEGEAGLPVGTYGDYTYSLVWANHSVYSVTAVDTNAGTVTTGAVYFARSANSKEYDSEGGTGSDKWYYNDVLLPAIPADVLTVYPYCWIRLNTDGSKQLFAGQGVWYYRDVTDAPPIACSVTPFAMYTCTDDSDEWEYLKNNSGNWGIANGLLWSSHDIPKGSATATKIYFEGSDPFPEGIIADVYQIKKETLDGIGEEVNRLCNTEEPMTPARMTEKLQDLSFDLQEITVTATEEQQTIYPDGYYGFSRIIVEAVEDSGTSGGGGIPDTGGGGEGDDEPEIKYPSVEDSELTYAETTMSVPTGKYMFGALEFYAYPVTHPYQVLQDINGEYRILQCSAPLRKGVNSMNTGGLWPIGGTASYTYHQYDAETETWKLTSSGTTSSYFSDSIHWTNHDIVNYDDTVWRPASSPMKPVIETVETYAPTGTDAIYTVTGDTMTDLGATVYQITGVQAKTPEEMVEALNYHAAIREATE